MITRWTPLAILVVSMLAPAMGQDDAALFNYMNNAVGPRPVFYYLDYVPLLPEVIWYAVRGLPFVPQALLYRLAPLAVMLVLWREWRLLLGGLGDQRDAALLSASAILVLRAVEVNIWANLMLIITPMFIAAMVHAIRVRREPRRYTPWGLAALLIAAVSVPFGILLAPVLLAQIPGDSDRVRRTQNGVLAAAVVVIYAWLNANFLEVSVVPRNPLAIIALFRQGFASDYRLYNVLAALSSIVLVVGGIAALRAHAMRSHDRLMMMVLAGVGLASVGGVLVSDRLPFNDGGFGGAHVLPALCAMMIVISWAILLLRDEARRAMLIGIVAGIAVLAIAGELYHHLRGPLELAKQRYDFLSAAQHYRHTCDSEGGLAFEDEDSSPVVLCRPRPFSDGLHPQFDLTPSHGVNDPGAPPGEHPFIYAGPSIF